MKTYEAMFLFDPTFASDMGKVEQEVGRLMERAGAEIVMCDKWDERKLAYEIKGRKRGCYVLAFFRAEPDRIAGLERDVQLSESVLRVLVLRADHMTEEDMKNAYITRSHAIVSGERQPKPAGRDRSTGPEGPADSSEDKKTTVEAPAPDAEPAASATPTTDTPASASAVAEPEPDNDSNQPQ